MAARRRLETAGERTRLQELVRATPPPADLPVPGLLLRSMIASHPDGESLPPEMLMMWALIEGQPVWAGEDMIGDAELLQRVMFERLGG